MNRPEQALQIAVVNLLKVSLVHPADFFSCPNGGYRTPREASLLKATGTRAGVPDLFVIWPGHLGGIELKAPKGRLSEEQAHWALTIRMNRHHWAECRSLEEVITALKDWNVPLRLSEAA